MIIDKQYKDLWQACAQGETAHPALETILFYEYQGKTVACAADGIMMAVVPVDRDDFDGDEYKVAIPAWAYKQINVISLMKDQKCGKRFTILEDGRIETFGQKVIYPTQNTNKNPDYLYVVEQAKKQELTPLNRFNFDIAIMIRLCKALGINTSRMGQGHISMMAKDEKSPIVVSSYFDKTDFFTPPFGLIMPIRVNDYSKKSQGGDSSTTKSA